MNKNTEKVHFSALEESIHILNILNNNLTRYFKSLVNLHKCDIDPDEVRTINQMTFKYGTVIINSYLDEYHDNFYPSLDIYHKTIYGGYFNLIKKQAINKFPGIKDYRNQITAHHLRDKGRSVYLYGNFRKYKIPQNLFEFRYLVHAIQMLTVTINNSFPDVFDTVSHFVTERFKNDDTPYQSEMTAEDVEIKIKELTDQLIEKTKDEK